MFFVKQGIFSYQNWEKKNQGNSFQVLNLAKQNKTKRQYKNFCCANEVTVCYMHMHA